jgi:hypothetical protein
MRLAKVEIRDAVPFFSLLTLFACPAKESENLIEGLSLSDG